MRLPCRTNWPPCLKCVTLVIHINTTLKCHTTLSNGTPFLFMFDYFIYIIHFWISNTIFREITKQIWVSKSSGYPKIDFRMSINRNKDVQYMSRSDEFSKIDLWISNIKPNF